MYFNVCMAAKCKEPIAGHASGYNATSYEQEKTNRREP